MRFLPLGFLCLILSPLVFAQARGEVESIGIGGSYRPGCWTPMVVRLVPTSGGNFTGRIEVVQEDLDRDQVLFTRQITLTGNPPNGSPLEQRFWMYFRPQPNRDRGALEGNLRTDELSEIIKVRLCSGDSTGKVLVSLPITQQLRPIESLRTGMGGPPRGQKVVLCVYDQNKPNFIEYQQMTGLTEDVSSVDTRDIATGLPDDVRGYDAIDAILWSDADPMKLSTEQLTAIEDYVKRGGKLVFAQDTATNQWQRNNVKFPLIMPVIVRGAEERDDGLATLRDLARIEPITFRSNEADKLWDKLKGPFRYAVCEVKPEASVILWQKDGKGEPILDAAGKPKPYAARMAVGAGSVTWVAQDLGDKQILGDRFSTRGWVYVWDKLFDWPNEPVFDSKITNDFAAAPYRSGITWDLGRSVLKYMDLPSTSAALIGIAVLFFIVYWVAAGPGSFLVLAKKGKASLSWFTFAAIALGATGVTVGIVKVVLRGAPQLQHVSVVRVAPGEPAIVHSQFGLYIPRDGMQRIELKEAAPGKASFVTAFNLHPAFNTSDNDFPAKQDYYVPVKEMHEADREAADPKVIQVPYRSTMKKFQADWFGSLPLSIDGTVKLSGSPPLITGTLTNNTGHDLRMVYLVVHHPAIERDAGKTGAQDLVLYVSSWPAGSSGRIDFGKEFDTYIKGGAAYIKDKESLFDSTSATAVKRYKGSILADYRTSGGQLLGNWTDFWYAEHWRGTYGGGEHEEQDVLTPTSFPLLSFYDRLPPSRNIVKENKGDDRFNFLRRGVRDLDMSASIGAGQMAIIGVSTGKDEKLPFPLEVQGDKIEGKGVVYYQFVVPVDRSAVSKAPTPQPATQPATKPKGKAEG